MKIHVSDQTIYNMGILTEKTLIETNKFLTSYCSTVELEIKKFIKRHKKIATGNLYNSINCNYEIIVNEDRFEIDLLYADYGEYVIGGRKPNEKLVPENVIKKWIVDKKIISKYIKKNKLKKKDIDKEKILNTLSWAIRMGIKKHGIPAYDFKNVFRVRFENNTFKKKLFESLSKDLSDQIKVYITTSFNDVKNIKIE